MKNKIKIFAAALGIVAIATPNIYAASNISYNIEHSKEKYKIILDGESYEIPDMVNYSSDDTLTLTSFKENLAKISSSVIKYDNNVITYNGGINSTTIHNEHVPLINNVGIMEKNVSTSNLINYFETYQLLPRRVNLKEQYEAGLEKVEGDDSLVKEYNVRIKNYTEDIARINNITLPSTSKRLLASIPYLGEKLTISDTVNKVTETITTDIDVNYYLYSLIFRDLRLSNIKYSVNSSEYKRVPSFNKDTYTYTIKLPESTPDDATISTLSTGYMQSLLEANNLTGYNLGLEVEDSTIKLVNGTGTLKVKNTFKVVETYGRKLDETYTSNPQRTYTIYFTKYDFLKGDLDRNGVITANDASIALDLYKNGNATTEQIKIGDMDNNGSITANDASMILDIYKNGK